MKTKITTMLLAIVVIILNSGCGATSKVFEVNYQTESSNTGKIILQPTVSTPSWSTYVTVNNTQVIYPLMTQDKDVAQVVINNVPNGDYKIQYCAYSRAYKEPLDAEIEVKMEKNKQISKIVTVPTPSNGWWSMETAQYIVYSVPLILFYMYSTPH